MSFQGTYFAWCVVFLAFSTDLVFMLASICRIQLGPARLAKTTQSPQRGRAVLLFRTTPATIYIIARTGAHFASRPLRSLSEFQAHITTPTGVARALKKELGPPGCTTC